MSFAAIAAFGAYAVFWAIYLPVAYVFNNDAEHDPDDDTAPLWLAELVEQDPVQANRSHLRHGAKDRRLVLK